MITKRHNKNIHFSSHSSFTINIHTIKKITFNTTLHTSRAVIVVTSSTTTSIFYAKLIYAKRGGNASFSVVYSNNKKYDRRTLTVYRLILISEDASCNCVEQTICDCGAACSEFEQDHVNPTYTAVLPNRLVLRHQSFVSQRSVSVHSTCTVYDKLTCKYSYFFNCIFSILP